MERLPEVEEEARETVTPAEAQGAATRPRGALGKRFYRASAVAVLAAHGVNLMMPRGNIISVSKAAWQAVLGVKKPDVMYVPTPHEVVDKMLDLAQVKKGDVLYDLGCGDGRIVVAAAERFGVKAVGFDVDPKRVAEARENVREHNVGHLVTIKQQDIFKADISEATVVTMYLLPTLNVRMMPKLAKLKTLDAPHTTKVAR